MNARTELLTEVCASFPQFKNRQTLWDVLSNYEIFKLGDSGGTLKMRIDHFLNAKKNRRAFPKNHSKLSVYSYPFFQSNYKTCQAHYNRRCTKLCFIPSLHS